MCAGNLTIERKAGDANSLTRMIKVTFSANSRFSSAKSYAVLLASPVSGTAFCTSSIITTTLASGAGDITTDTMVTSDSRFGGICKSTGPSNKGAGSDSVATFGASTTSCAHGSDTDPFTYFALKFVCPAYPTQIDETITTNLLAGSDNAAGNAVAYAQLSISCTAAAPVYNFCATFDYCTPYTGAPNYGQYADTCAASSAASSKSLLDTCKASSSNTTYFACKTTAGSSACTDCPNVLNVQGMRYNRFSVTAPTQAQIDNVIAAVRAGSIVGVPPWATIMSGASEGCTNLTTVACTGSNCNPSNIYPPSGQTNFARVMLNADQYNTVATNHRGASSFTSGSSFATFLFPPSLTSSPVAPVAPPTTRREGAASESFEANDEARLFEFVDAELREERARRAPGPSASTAAGTIPTTLTSSCPGSSTTPFAPIPPVAPIPIPPIPPISPIFGGSVLPNLNTPIGTGTGAATGCCAEFYKYAYCTLKFPQFTTCSCGGSTTCPSNVKCSSSEKSYLLFLLFLLCIPFWILILCSIIIACCMIRRRKRGWQERQLATFDPEPHPAAPPPPVNVYEECPQYAHHDGASGYSDVHHTNDEFYSAA